MARPATGRPSDMELVILKVLWERGPSTVREVYNVLRRQHFVGYTTVLKMMQIMRDKGLLRCDTRQQPQMYRHRQRPGTVLKKLTGDLLERAFNGSTVGLLLHALEHKKVSAQVLVELRRIIDEAERRSR